MLDPCATPAIDGLVVVAHDERHAGLARKQAQPAVLNCVGVLELVHQQVLEAALVVGKQFGVVAPEFVGTQQQFGEVDQATAFANGFVFLVQGNHLPTLRVTFIIEMFRAQSFIFLAVDKVLNLARYPAAIVDSKTFQESLDEA